MKVKIIDLRVTDLKDILRDRNLPTSGSKADLIKRVEELMASDEVEMPEETSVQAQIDDLKTMMSQMMEMMHSHREQSASGSRHHPTNNQENGIATTLSTPSRTEIDSTSTRNRGHSVKEIAETIPEFDPTNESSLSIEQFVERVNASQNAYDWEVKSLLLAVYSKLKGAAKLWFDATEQFPISWQVLQQQLVDEFGCTIDDAEKHRKLSEAGRRSNESVEEYCFRITALGRKYKLSEQAIIRHTRDGLRHRELQSAIAVLQFKSTKEMRESCVEFIRHQHANRQQPQALSTTKSKVVERETNDVNQRNRSKDGPAKDVKCYNCFERGHMSANCPKPQRRRRCSDCQKVHALGEPTNCGKKAAVSRRTRSGDCIFTKMIVVDGKALVAFVDTGSQCSMIRKSVANRLAAARERCSLAIRGIGGGVKKSNELIRVNIQLDDVSVSAVLYTVDDDVLDEDVLLGQNIFEDHPGVKVVVERGDVTFRTVQAEVKSPLPEIPRETDLGQGDYERLVTMLDEYRDCFASDLQEIGKTELVSLKIELDTETPIAQMPYRVPQPKRQTITDMINELLSASIIQPSESEYASPITLVKKNDGTDRFCIDYRRLNQHMRKEIYPMPNIEERLQDAKQYCLFTSLDLNSGYYQIPVEERSRKYTAFVTTDGLYEFRRMPFGLRNAPMAFQRLMAKLKDMLLPDDMIHYMDDILIGSDTTGEMFGKLERVFEALRKAGLTLNPKKCSFFKSTISFLGHKLTPQGIEPGEVKTAAISNFRVPTTVTEVRRFLGLSGYFRKFVPGYAVISEPLRCLLRKNEPFNWTKAQEVAFQDLKLALTKSPVLVPYAVNAEHQIHTDASAIGVAAVLMQETSDGWKPVAYYSRSTSPNETKMHSYELETLAVVEGLERFRYYVYGKRITVITDCSAVTATWAKRELVPRIARWWLRIQDYSITMEHRTETRMGHVDALSRMPYEESHSIEPATLRVDRADVSEADWLFTMQLQDDEIQTTIKRIQDGETQATKEFLVENGRLFKRLGERKLWVVPRNLRYKVTQDIHEKGGHLGVDRTIEKVQLLMWFPRMRNFIKSCLKSCMQCSFNKCAGGKTEGEYHFSEIDAIPFKVVHIDHLGPFPRSSKRNEHIVVMVDAFTKVTFLRAVPNTSTRHVLKVIDEISSYVGMPQTIISDRGTSYTSKEFQRYCANHAVKHVLNAVRTPRANGQVERMNRTILSMLRPLTEKNKNWDEGLRAIQWSLNTSMSATTKQSPYDLLFGYQPRDILGNQLVSVLHDLNTTPECPETRTAKLTNVRETAAQRIMATREKAKQRYDQCHAQPRAYSSGDLVLITNEAPSLGTSRKLEPRFKGPFVVSAVLGNDRYVVQDLPGSNRKQRHYESVYASEAMKPWCLLPPEIIVPDDDEFGEDTK